MPTKQISAVDWLYETLWKQTDFSLPSNILKQAKEIEKQNIINSYHVGYSRAIMPKDYNAQDYYEQNFNKTI